VEQDERRVNAKSLLGVLYMGIVRGARIKLIAHGVDEKEAVEGLAEILETTGED
jgi:phosphocarrier protein